MWGRTENPGIATQVVMTVLFFMAPLMVATTLITNRDYQGSLVHMWCNINLNDFLVYSQNVFVCGQWLLFWLAFQYILALLPDLIHVILPMYRGSYQKGNLTPAGNILTYNINGLQSFLITHVLFGCLVGKGWIDPTFIVDHILEFFYAASFFGYYLTFFAYFKAHLFSSHPEDNKQSGSTLYDLIMGVELNPRLFGIDFKLFFNGRPGIILWSILNLCFAYKQYTEYGIVGNNMRLLILLQGVYIIDFFFNEAWYLGTLDISLDHFGFYLAWGDCAWLPFMYTIQGHYLAHHDPTFNDLSLAMMILLFCLGAIGYWLFRVANHQKDAFRRYLRKYITKPSELEDGTAVVFEHRIFEAPAKAIKCSYTTKKQGLKSSYLLVSGLWSLARHLNYTGDILLSAMWGLCCGFDNALPHFYTIYILLLLLSRAYRDETKCRGKYGNKAWDTYCAYVPYRFIPGLC